MIIENKREMSKDWSVGDVLVARGEEDIESIYFLVCDNDTLVVLRSGVVYDIEDLDRDVVILCGRRMIIEDVFENDDIRVILGS